MLTRYYRDVHGLFASTGILFNHESPRRSDAYVSRKITKAAVRIAMGLQNKLRLGDVEARIDFGYAREYMEAAWSLLQADEPVDCVIGTGEVHSVREFLEEAFRQVGLDAYEHVEFDPKLLRPGKTSVLCADASKARRMFGR